MIDKVCEHQNRDRWLAISRMQGWFQTNLYQYCLTIRSEEPNKGEWWYNWSTQERNSQGIHNYTREVFRWTFFWGGGVHEIEDESLNVATFLLLWLIRNVWMCFVDFPAWYSWLAADTEVYLETSPCVCTVLIEQMLEAFVPRLTPDWLDQCQLTGIDNLLTNNTFFSAAGLIDPRQG